MFYFSSFEKDPKMAGEAEKEAEEKAADDVKKFEVQ